MFYSLCAVYILLAPKISVTGRERNVFVLKERDKNTLVNMDNKSFETVLCRSRIYGSYVYCAKINADITDGNIERDNSMLKYMPLPLKILCCILSEILIFVRLIGRFIFFLRSINIPRRFVKITESNGFEKLPDNID